MPELAGKPARRGIFGGTFNPIHNGHLKVARACADALSLEQIRLIPAGEPPHRRDDLAPATDRFRMVELAIAGQSLFCVDACELARPGPSYTFNTVTHLLHDQPADWHLLLGLDAVLGIDQWHRADELVRQLPIAILFRPGGDFAALTALPTLQGVDFSNLSTWDRNQPLNCHSTDGITLSLVPVPPCPEAATEIRLAIRNQHPAPSGLSAAVRDYIIEHQLYA